MSTLSSVSLPKPKDWQDFERKMCELMKRHLDDPETQMHGRNGQPQHGVDIYGYRNRDTAVLVGVQCKRYDKPITSDELNDELEKALKFQPPISEFILATTVARDAAIQRLPAFLPALAFGESGAGAAPS